MAEGSPKPGCPLGQLWLQSQAVSFSPNTHCPCLGYTTAQPGKGAPLRLAPASRELSGGRHRNPPQGCSELDLVGAGSVHLWFQSKD